MKKVGVQFVAEGEQEFFRVLDASQTKFAEMLAKEEEFATANKTLFAGMMEAMSPQQLEAATRIIQETAAGVLEIGTAFDPLPKKVTEFNSVLMEMLREEEAVSTASKTLFADMMRDLPLDEFDRVTSGVLEIGTAFSSLPQHSSRATQAIHETVQAVEELTQATVAQTEAAVASAQASVEFGNKWRAAFFAFRDIGKTPQEALAGLNDAAEQGIKPQTLLNRVLDERFGIEQNLTKSGLGWNDIQKEMNDLAGKNVGAQRLVSESAIQSSRAFFALTLAGFGLMTINRELEKAFGQDLPDAFKKTSDAIQIIASFGSAGAFVGGVQGALLGGLAGSILAIGTAAVATDPQIQQLNQSLENMSKKDELAQTLANLFDITMKDAEALVQAAGKSSEFASKLETLAKSAEPVPPLISAIKIAIHELGIEFDGLPDLAGGFNEFLKNSVREITVFGSITRDVVDNAVNLFKTLQQEVMKLAGWFDDAIYPIKSWDDITRDAFAKGDEAAGKFDKALLGVSASASAVTSAVAEAKSIIAEADHSAEKAASAFHTLSLALQDTAFRMAQLTERTQNQLAAAQAAFDEAQAIAARERDQAEDRALQQRQDRLSDLWTDLQDKLTDIRRDAAQKQVQIEQDLSDRLMQINRQRNEDLAALDFNTHEQLLNAKTRREEEDILRRALFQRGQINIQSNDQLWDARKDANDRLAILDQETKDAIALAQRRYDEERDIAFRTYREQVEAARQAEADKLEDARRNLEQRNLAIEQSYKLERDQIEFTRQKALEVYQYQLGLIGGLTQAMVDLSLKFVEFTSGLFGNVFQLPPLTFISDVLKQYLGNVAPLPLPFTAPTTTTNEFAPLERTTQLLTGGTTNHSTNTRTYHFNIYDATDPVKVRNEVARYLEDQAYT